MIPSLSMNDILTKWRDEIQNSVAINNFCQTNYSKDPKIFVGVDPSALPTQTDCPYIIIHSGSKKEGINRKEYRYTVPVEWSIVNSTKTTVNDVTELDGLYECDDLGQLILSVLAEASSSNPVSYVNYNTLKEETFPQFTGNMEVKVSIYPTMGEDITY